MDLVGTCPKGFWQEWIAEGDAAGTPETGEEYGWQTRCRSALLGKPGDRFYVVAHGRLRGWAPIVRVDYNEDCTCFVIVRRGQAVACTLPCAVPGFRGVQRRWWDRAQEMSFESWMTP